MKEVQLTCGKCNKVFQKADKEYQRRLRSGISIFYCSRKCGAKQTNFGAWIGSEAAREHIRQLSKTTAIKFDQEIRPFAEYARRARCRKQHEFDLSREYLNQLWTDQKGLCALSNIPLVHGGTDLNTMASLDRIDSIKGYIKGNVQFVSCALNYAKSTRSDESIRALIALIKQHS